MMLPFSPARRRFVTGLASSTALSLLHPGSHAFAAGKDNSLLQQQTLSGDQFNLNIGYAAVNFTGKTCQATAINGSVPAPTLRWKEGETVVLNVRNNLAVDSSIHWHGIILPSGMDGVPGLSFAGIRPGESFRYQFKVQQSGTFWYHSHSAYQEQTGMYGAIVIEPKNPHPYDYDRDYVIVLSDWSDQSPDSVYANLKRLPHIYNINERTLQDWRREVAEKGLGNTMQARAMWNKMRMADSDISDVTGKTYTFLMNGKTPADGWVGLFKRGEKVLLRFINAGAMTIFDVRIPGLKMTVVAADGQATQPVTVDEFRIGAAETYDVLVEPSSEQAYSLFCQAIDRSGFAHGTLTPDPGMVSALPEMDESPLLTHLDMGMSHSTPNSGSTTMDHSMSQMEEMDDDCSAEHAAMGHCEMRAVSLAGLNHSSPPMGSGEAGFGSDQVVSFEHLKTGPRVDMLARGAQYRLDDPGVGLRNNGRKVLRYADLFNLYPTFDLRQPERELVLHLTGNMSRYIWSIDGIPSGRAPPIEMSFGERVRITLVNHTMMNHPMHLHGMWSELETGDGGFIPRKHTVIVQPGAKISYLLTADARGRWAYHCHLLYHMAAMFREVRVV